MTRTMLGGKIHRATVTAADLDYEGSLTVDEELLESVDMLAGEAVDVWNIGNGARLRTYAIAGPRGSGVICANGASAHLLRVGDLVIIASFVVVGDAAARTWQPRVVFVDAANHIVERRAERRAA